MGNAITNLFAGINNKDRNMSEEYKNRLKGLLRSLFQFDSADLDFGIYRIMNKKRDEIERFIENDLIDAVDEEFGRYTDSKHANIKDEVEAIKAEIRKKLGDDALDENENVKKILVTTPFAKELTGKYEQKRAAMKNSEMTDQNKAELFSHIYQFFSRYYDNGDFLSLRRYSQKEKYAIPYNGEEVILHWANKDQYYIKTGEYFKNYSFKAGDFNVNFKIRDAQSTTNNNKAENRYFIVSLSEENLVYNPEIRTLTIFFEYRGLGKDEEKEFGTKNIQEAIIEKINNFILSNVQDAGLRSVLAKIEKEKTLLEKHLRNYTKRNTTDYFIHKDLKGFLKQELDFYIKNEVFHLDDLGTENEVNLEQYVSRVKVMKRICLKVINFLGQIEDFQKMLFEKKKFVLKTDYCMTIDKVPLVLYPEIVKNKDQLNEWKILYGAGEEKQSTITSFGSKSIDEVYLKEHPYLVLDTKFFDREYKDELLASFNDLDEATGGLIIKSENWQALNLMQEKYREKVKCTYIDPPYNTGNDEFIYKDNYQHSSWLTMMENRQKLARIFLNNEGIEYISISDNELNNVTILMKNIFNDELFIGPIIWKSRQNKDNRTLTGFSNDHEYILCFGKKLRGSERDITQYSNPDNDPRGPWTSGNMVGILPESERPNCHYDLNDPKTGVNYGKPKLGWRFDKNRMQLLMSENRILWPSDPKGRPRQKVFLNELKTEFTGFSSVINEKIFTYHGSKEFDDFFSQKSILYPKPTLLLKVLIEQTSKNDTIVLDFFAGSGTTAHAVLNLNKEDEDNSNRKYILVEMGDYFDTIMKPRIQKVMYSRDWKEGKPQSTDGISHIFKYQYLEQYEDTLNNIEFKDAGSYQRTLSEMEGYFLRYMLDFETRDSSPCRFNVEKLTKPFDYTLRITHGNEMKDEKVDLVETFNYLLGIHVKQIKTFNNNSTYYRAVFGRKNEDEIAIIWRDTENIDLKADKAFIEGTIFSCIKPSKTYINADFYVEGALPIEPEFKKLMVV